MTDKDALDAGLLAIMQCPDCAGTLSEEFNPHVLACSDCGLRYPVRDGIPVMLVDEAIRPGDAQ